MPKHFSKGKRQPLLKLYIIGLLFLLPFIAASLSAEKIKEGKIISYHPSLSDSENRQPLNYNDINALRWVDPQGRQPLSYEEWRNQAGSPGPFQMEVIRKSAPLKNNGFLVKFCIIINTDLYPLVTTAVDQYILDLNNEDYDVELITASGGTPEDLRELLTNKYYEGMKGCVLIGNLPIAWYEIYNCFDFYENEQFPCDLFYMDLDGSFRDSDNDGLYDEHTGDVFPEIWLGRLTFSPLAYGADTEQSLLTRYFDKNNRYRTGQLALNKRALVYIDDDWADFAGWWDENVGLTYDIRTLVSDPWVTWADDYETHLLNNYEFIEVCVHSSAYSHSFKNPSEQWSSTTAIEVKNIGPIAHFYNLFACSNSRFVETNNMGACYLYNIDNGLATVGSTKTGSMLDFEYFYSPLGQGKTIGESLRDWFNDLVWDYTYNFDQMCWHYGMTLQGDPTLTISGWDVKFISSNNFGWAPLTVNFAGKSEHNVLQWRWSFGDGDTALAPVPSHIYTEPGTHNVSLQILTDSGHLYSVMENNYITVLADTLTGMDQEATTGVTFEYVINLTNNIPLYRLQIPLEYGGPLNLKYEGHSIVDCRAGVFSAIDYINYDGNNKHLCLNMEGGSTPLPAGTGPLIKIKFKIQGGEPGQYNILEMDGYDTFEPINYGYPLIYQPALISGTIIYNPAMCCSGTTGNVDCSAEEIPDIADITRLIDFLYISHNALCCEAEADVDVSGGIPDISDITRLIDYLYLSHDPLAECP